MRSTNGQLKHEAWSCQTDGLNIEAGWEYVFSSSCVRSSRKSTIRSTEWIGRASELGRTIAFYYYCKQMVEDYWLTASAVVNVAHVVGNLMSRHCVCSFSVETTFHPLLRALSAIIAHILGVIVVKPRVHIAELSRWVLRLCAGLSGEDGPHESLVRRRLVN